MADMLDDFAESRAADVVLRGGETFIAAEAAFELLREAERRGLRVLGLEGFLVGEDDVFPALSRIADFSDETAAASAQRALELLAGPWSEPPTHALDQMHGDAHGRHMVVVVLAT